MRDVVGFILGGGQGSRLFPLTQFHSKPAVPIGGKYRLIDIPISNCIHSGINRIFVLTQLNSASLHRHISTTYRFDSFSDGFVEIMAAEQDPRQRRLVPGHSRRGPPTTQALIVAKIGSGFDPVGVSPLPHGLPRLYRRASRPR